MSERTPTTANAGDALEVDDLRVDVAATGADIVDEVTLSIRPGEVLGLVGESGSGKTTVGLAVLGHARKGARISGGRVEIGGRSMLTTDVGELRRHRGELVSYVPQDPSTALNPALRIDRQIFEVLEAHGFGESGEARRARLIEVMTEVLLAATPEFLRRYPHQLSGGQQQRVGLAMAFACRPRVIVLDEPTTGLDVSTQAHVLATVRELCRAHGVAALYVTHDLAVVANLADRVAVMYAGRIVEQGPTALLFAGPPTPTPDISSPPSRTSPETVTSSGSPGVRRRPGIGRSDARSPNAARARPRNAGRRSLRSPSSAPTTPCAASIRVHRSWPARRLRSRRRGRASWPPPTPRSRWSACRPGTPGEPSSTTSTCRSLPVSAWRSSGSPVRARPRCRVRSAACTASGAATSSSARRRSRRPLATGRSASVCGSSTSSRTPTAR